MAGHDINYISITGALNAIGVDGQVPSPPLNLIGDYGGGTMFLIMGILASLLKAEKTGIGEIVDAAIIDGTTSMMGIVHSLHSLGQWTNKRQSNLLDGSMPFYRCYETKDHKYMAVGCLEPKFFSIMLNCLNIDKVSFGSQHDKGLWAKQNKTLEDLFFMKTRDEWSIIFNDTDACVTPVLSYTEAASHPQNVNRSNLIDIDGFIQTGPAPRFSNSDANIDFSIPKSGADTRSILKEIGYNESLIDELTSQLIVYPNE
jgi:alpha-methylacyl-CoA racemase